MSSMAACIDSKRWFEASRPMNDTALWRPASFACSVRKDRGLHTKSSAFGVFVGPRGW
jgi:hypothetical protein